MKLLPKHGARKSILGKITLIDVDGESMTFDTVKEAAKFLDVNISRIYAALNQETKVRGCSVKAERE